MIPSYFKNKILVKCRKFSTPGLKLLCAEDNDKVEFMNKLIMGQDTYKKNQSLWRCMKYNLYVK